MTERKLEKTVELDASPEQVWELIATGPGISTWFVPHEVEEREGGAAKASFASAARCAINASARPRALSTTRCA